MTVQSELHRPAGLLDVLRLPLIGRALRWRHGRLLFQVPLLLIAVLLIYDGFTGPALAAQNLATVAPWVHYRGLVVIALLLAGNLFCMGCPFALPRTLAKRFSLRKRRFPRALRSKWLAVGSLFFLFFLYEWLDLWASPALTAWVIVAYFVASFVLEALFAESAFCKYVCPLGTFNFVYATASPLQVTARDPGICHTCVGKECVNGSYSPEPIIRIDQIAGGQRREVVHDLKGTPGCGTLLFVPQIQSNLDCVFCLDCARACPHENVALMTRTPGRELLRADAWPKRWDVSFLVIMLAFMGIMNAFGMVPPIHRLMQGLADALGITSEGLLLLIVFSAGSLLLPVALTLLVASLSRALTTTTRKYTLRETVAAFAPAFVPLGFGIWTAHYFFHFLTGFLTIIPVMQYFLLDHHITFFGQPRWSWGGIEDPGIIGLIQAIVLIGGFLWTMVIAQRAALRLYRRQGMIGLLPWAALFLGMMFVALQIFGLPMEMRGTLLG